MIVLDTNVLSEPLRRAPSATVIAWRDRQPIATLTTTALTVAELRTGLPLLPKGRRRDSLRSGIGNRWFAAFSGRILPFDEAAASAWSEIQAARRNTGHFAALGLEMINPWQE